LCTWETFSGLPQQVWNVDLAARRQIVDHSHRRAVGSIRENGYPVVPLKVRKLLPKIRFDAWPEHTLGNGLPYPLSEPAKGHLFIVAKREKCNSVGVETGQIACGGINLNPSMH